MTKAGAVCYSLAGQLSLFTFISGQHNYSVEAKIKIKVAYGNPIDIASLIKSNKLLI
ncbi:MAG: hypothetical protein JWP29_5652 [Rhodoferax sp.]|jgi:hypothetical protein|nr:hypothetical protein [Rhodoferax sp.]